MALAEAGLLSVVVPVADDTDLAGIGVFAATPTTPTQSWTNTRAGGRAGIFRYQTHPVRGFPEASLPQYVQTAQAQ